MASAAACAIVLCGAASGQAADPCTYGPNACRPARPADQKLWGELQPTDTYPYPGSRDHTAYDGNQLADGVGVNGLELWTNIAATNGFVFTSSSCCVEVWDVGSTPKQPRLAAFADGWTGYGSNFQNGDWPYWAGLGHVVVVVFDVAVPAGDPSIFVSGGLSGTLIWNASAGTSGNATKQKLTAYYQDGSTGETAVWATTIGGKEYALAAGQFQAGIRVYSLDAARKVSRCLEGGGKAGGPPYGTCPGVYLGVLPSTQPKTFLDGAGDVLAASPGVGGNVELWDLSSLPALPSAPIVSAKPPQWAYGIALWKDGGRDYLGLREAKQGQIFDVTSCVQNKACSSLGAPLATIPLSFTSTYQSADYSRSGSTGFLFFGQDNYGQPGPQDEALYDVSDPSHPRSVTPPQTITVNSIDSANYPNKKDYTIGYWGWYNSQNPTGFAFVAPRAALFAGPYLYRAAYSLFDVHKWNGPPAPDGGTAADGGAKLDGGSADSAPSDAAIADGASHGGSASAPGGCGCRAAGNDFAPWWSALGLLALAISALARRRGGLAS